MAHWRIRVISFAMLVLVVSSLGRTALADTGIPARVVSVTADHATTVVEQQDGSKRWSLKGPDVLQIAGRYLEEGDLVSVTGDPPTNVTIRTASTVGFWPAIVAIIVPGLILLVIAGFASGWQPQCFLVGADKRVSNSKCQVVLWFGVAISTYLAMLVLRFIGSDCQLVGGIAIPANVLAMTGLSGLTFAGAKMIAVTKNNGNPPAGVGAPAVAPGIQKQTAIATNWWTDLFTNDQGELDFGDFQMILIVWISVIIYLVSAYLTLTHLPLQAHASLPDVDASLLAAFGIGQGAYLAKKAALPVGTG